MFILRFVSALTENRFSGPGSGDAGTIYRIVAYVWIVLGLAYVALIINYISIVLVRKAEKMERMSKAKIEVIGYRGDEKTKYCRTSMARIPSGPWKYVRDRGSSS